MGVSPALNVERDYGWWALPDGKRARVSLNLKAKVLYVYYPTGVAVVLGAVADQAAADALVAGLDPNKRDALPKLLQRCGR